MTDLKSILPEDDYNELRLAGLVQKIEQGHFMPDYLTWLGNHQPELNLTWNHVKYIGDHIQRVIDGGINKLAISIQPRIGKTTTITIPLPVYYLDKNPKNRIILAAYNQTLANKFSVKCRSLAEKVGVPVSKTKRARNDWETDWEGGVRAVGVGSGVAGYGANLIVIDDPIRSRKDANSPAMQRNVFDWYNDDIFTRREPNCPIVLIGTRWHENDLTGQVLAAEGIYSKNNPNGWHVINLPAIAEKDDPLGRNEGEALCPDRFNIEQLLAIKNVLRRNFEALYQGRPTGLEGGMFKRKWFKYVEYLPKEETDLKFCRFWDKAVSESGDYTVGVLMAYGKTSGNIYIIDVVRGRWSTYEREQIILKTARKDHLDYGHVYIRFEKEPGSSGEDSANYSIKLLVGFPVKAIPSRKNKVTRAEPFADQCEGGNVYLLKRDWNRDFTEELTLFPNGRNDDQVDAASGAFNELGTTNAFIKIGLGV